MNTNAPRAQAWTVIAQDPGFLHNGEILTTRVSVPAERLGRGPRGSRVAVIDYNASTGRLYRPRAPVEGEGADPYRDVPSRLLLSDPRFHAQNVYALVSWTLARFERALGRRVSWGFGGQQIKVAPHAFQELNAYYSREAQGILFGYHPRKGEVVFTCLAHDVVVHETAHAILDGLRECFGDLSHPDQAAFHEGFSDAVALLSVLSMPEVVRAALARMVEGHTIPRHALTAEGLKRNALFGLAEQFGGALSAARRDALRRSAELPPSRHLLDDPALSDPHDRGEVLVAALMNALLDAWLRRVGALHDGAAPYVSEALVVEVGAAAAEALLTMVIRALDYLPPVDVRFDDYLAALLTSDAELRPDDRRDDLRGAVRTWFSAYGIDPPPTATAAGCWRPAEGEFHYDRTHLEAIQSSPEEVFRFLWENRNHPYLRLPEDAYTRVLSVRPCVRVGEDGFTLRETVAEYKQRIDLTAASLPEGIRRPEGMPDDFALTLVGGGTLIFDEYGRLKYHVRQRIRSERQTERLASLWQSGALAAPAAARSDIARLHRGRRSAADAGRGEAY